MPRCTPLRALPLAIVLLGVACAPAASGGATDVVSAVPFADGERLTYTLHNGQGELIGGGLLSATLEGEVWRLEQRYWLVPPGPEAVVDEVRVEVDARTLKPIAGGRVVTPPREGDPQGPVASVRTLSWVYQAGEGESRLAVRLNEREQAIRLRDHYYDNESSLWLWRTLDFADEYDERYVSANAIEPSQTTVNIRVAMRQTIEVPAGTFDTWRILVRTGRAVRTAWVNVEPPHEVVQWDNGEIIFRLETVAAAGTVGR